MKVAFVESHAKWFPHRSGYSQYIMPDENSTARIICNTAIAILEDKHPLDQFAYIEMNDYYKCDCKKNKKCSSYNEGLNNISLESSKYDLAIQYHIDNGPSQKGGPLLLAKGDDRVKMFSAGFLKTLEELSGLKRRGLRAFKGIHYNGIFDYNNPDVKEAFGRKCFLEKGADNAIIIELGKITNQKDHNWLNTGKAIYDSVESTCAAFDVIL